MYIYAHTFEVCTYIVYKCGHLFGALFALALKAESFCFQIFVCRGHNAKNRHRSLINKKTLRKKKRENVRLFI